MHHEDLQDRLGDLIRYGRLASVDLAAGRVTVALGDMETQATRWATGGSGGTRVWSRPQVGEQVLVLAPEGDIAGAVAFRGLDCAAFPPLGDADRELVRFADGAVLAYDPASHKLEAVLPAGAAVSIVAPGGVRLEADVTITGDVEIEGGLTVRGQVYGQDTIHAGGDVTADTVSLQGHVHDNVQPGSGVSGKPVA